MCFYLIIRNALIVYFVLIAVRVDEWMESHIVVLTSALKVFSRLGLDLHFRTFFLFRMYLLGKPCK